MLGYTKDGSNLSSKLISALSKPSVQESLKMSGLPTPSQGDKVISDRCETHHIRECIYPFNGEKADSIRIRHLWLGYERTP